MLDRLRTFFFGSKVKTFPYDPTLPNERRRRASALHGEIMRIVAPKLDRNDLGQVSIELKRLLELKGVELVTDETRKAMGFGPRDENGWTKFELQAYEAFRLKTMLEPVYASEDPNTIGPLRVRDTKGNN